MDYKKTLENSIKRKSKFIDEKVQYFNDIPLFSWIEISPIDACNRKCVFCPKSDPKIAPDTFKTMDNKYIEKLARELKEMDYNGTIVFAGYGEPLLDKKIFDKIKILSGICNLEITTNGDPLTIKNINKLVDSGINKIVVSLYDGPEQIKKYEKLFSKAGISKDKYILRDRWYKGEEFSDYITNRAGTVKTGKQPKQEELKDKTCYYPSYHAQIDWNGDMYLCPHDWQRRNPVGNLMQKNSFDLYGFITNNHL